MAPADDLDPVDRDALTRSLEMLRRREPSRNWQLDAKLKDEGWFATAAFASFCMQCDNLHLEPWEDAPVHADPDDPNEPDKAAQALLRGMLVLGISEFEPDPLTAIAAVESKKRGASASK